MIIIMINWTPCFCLSVAAAAAAAAAAGWGFTFGCKFDIHPNRIKLFHSSIQFKFVCVCVCVCVCECVCVCVCVCTARVFRNIKFPQIHFIAPHGANQSSN